jgi:2-(1,2-epoxy-1,2-dihydrophenyl)acetyl-CoA isomerase
MDGTAAALHATAISHTIACFMVGPSLYNHPSTHPISHDDPAAPPEETQMSTDLIEQVKDGVAVLTLNRPDRLNAMSRPMLDALLEALPRLAEDPAVGVVVLTGAGRGFCAGGDVKAMAEGNELGGQTMEDRAQALRSRMETSRWLHEMPKPTIAMMRGPAAGAGLSLAMACDMRIASDTVKLGTAFARVGYSGDFGGSYYLTQLVGTAKARELYFTADLLDAQQALGLGLVNRVVADARLEEETMALASRLARGPRVAYRYMKRNMNAAETASLKDMLDLEAWNHTRTGMTEDHREAARAFVEKREPQFKGR